jgi:uncharacterized protein YaaW (UPF0174 family)
MKKPIDPTMITIGKIAKERTALQKQFNAMKGDPTKANQRRLLKDVITEIDKDLEPFPSEKAYREAYREHSKPINAIEESTSFIDILKQNKGYLNPHTVLPENVPGKYLRSVDRAREMKGLYATQPELKTSFEQHINNDLMQNVFKNGRVDLKALEKWRARNPGAFDLYEGLDTKLKNTTNAQTFLNRVEAANKAAIKKYYKEHTRGVLGETTDKAIRSSFGNSFAQKEKRQKILELLKKDKNAMKGYQNAAIEHFEDHAMKYMNSNTVNQYMKKYERSLQEVLSPEQFKIIKEAQRLISDRAKTTKQMNTVNSSTSANQLTNANLMEIASTGQLKSYIKILSRRFGKFGPVLDSIADTFLTKYNATESQKFFTVLDRALESGPELQKLLLSQPLKDAKSQATFLKHLEDYAKSRAYIVSGVLNKDKESEQ